MPIIVWNDDLRVHVAEIDRQHLKLVKTINDLHEAMLAGKSRDVLGQLIGEMSNYAATHFAVEESYFREFGYTEAAEHVLAHEAFTAKVAQFKAGVEQGRTALSMDVLNFLTNWLLTHIQGVDKKYMALFHEKGLS